MDRSLLLFLPALLAAPLHAQLVTVVHENNDVPNGSMITITGSADEYELFTQPLCRLNASSGRDVMVRRYEHDVQPGTQNHYCWGTCYPPVDEGVMLVWTSQMAVTMMDGVDMGGFTAYHLPEGLPGISIYRYVWYDAADPHDTAWVDIAFDTSDGTGVEDLAGSVTQFSIHPNPSQGEAVRFTIDLADDVHAEALTIRNSAGAVVHTRPMGTTVSEGPVTLAGLAPGIYLAAIERKGRVLASRRFVVAQ